MKIRQLLAVTIIAALVGHYAPSIPNFMPFEPVVHAAGMQQVGYTAWNNIHMAYVNADFTDGNGVTTLQNIPRLQWSLPASQGVAFRIDCDIAFTQATNVADSFGIQFSNSPTNALVGGLMYTNATTSASIAPATITNATATAVVTGTPAVATALYVHIGGVVEQASNTSDTIVNISVSQSTAANVIVVKRGSGCVSHSML